MPAPQVHDQITLLGGWNRPTAGEYLHVEGVNLGELSPYRVKICGKGVIELLCTYYIAQGDAGALVTDFMGRQVPNGLVGIHFNLLVSTPFIIDCLPAESEQERAHSALTAFTMDGFGYFLEQSTRSQTIGYSLLDSPIGLAAWMPAPGHGAAPCAP
jgi:hypothetical protein